MTQDNKSVYLGDVIIGIDDKSVDSFDDIFNILFEYSIGDTVTLKYIRDKKEKTARIKLEELKPRKR